MKRVSQSSLDAFRTPEGGFSAPVICCSCSCVILRSEPVYEDEKTLDWYCEGCAEHRP
jgi:hypothetical protein